ncbi:MAG: hypothetical protein F6K28_44500 [Microcoleus sp. SIO2G3]|nr:hypothetical protein [Microcoleus sp. SIO2G3]
MKRATKRDRSAKLRRLSYRSAASDKGRMVKICPEVNIARSNQINSALLVAARKFDLQLFFLQCVDRLDHVA